MDKMALHQKVVQYVAEHSCFSQIFSPEQLNEIGKEIVSNDEPRAPDLYCEIIRHFYREPRINLEILVTGLDFILKNSQGQPKQDLINKLRDINNVGGVFEVVLIGALYRPFKENLDLYPLVVDDNRAEAKLRYNKNDVYIEATVLGFDKELQQCLNSGYNQAYQTRGTGIGRVIKKIEDKFINFSSKGGNVLIISQNCHHPYECRAFQAIEKFLLNEGNTDPNCFWGGIFYFDRFECKQWIENTNCHENFKISCDLVGELQQAFQVMRPCSS